MFHLILKLIAHIAYWYAGQYQSGTIHQITLSGLEPADYRIRLIAEGDPGDRKVYRRSFTLPENPLDCSPYLTDEGISIDGNTVTFTFASTGVYSSFTCQLDRNQPVSCKPTFQSAINDIVLSILHVFNLVHWGLEVGGWGFTTVYRSTV